MPIVPTHPTVDLRRRDGAFSLIEVIVAMMVLSIVVGGFALAVSTSERAGGRERAVANKVAIAKKAHEQLQGNVDAQNHCGRIWAVDERAAVNRTTAVRYRSCTWPSSGSWRLVDDDGRTYRVSATMQAFDESADGTGLAKSLDTSTPGGDTDFDTRDRIDVDVDVTLDATSAAGLPADVAADPYELSGRMSWESSETLGTARVLVCLLDRPDRAMANGRCVSGGWAEDRPAEPMSGVRVTLTPTEGGTTYSATSAAGVASFNGILPDGTYEVSASGYGSRSLYKYSPAVIAIDGADPQEATVYLSRRGSTFEVCARIANPDNYGFGWKITDSALSWGAVGAELRKTVRLNPLSDSWRCVAQAVTDPLGYSNRYLYRGRYVFEVSQYETAQGSLRVRTIGACPTGNSASWSFFSASGFPVPSTIMTNSSGLSSYRRGINFTERDDANARLCIEFNSTPRAAVPCTAGTPGCILVDRVCNPASCLPSYRCSNCGTIPVQPDGVYPWIGPSGSHNGPNESNVSCRNSRSATTWSSPFYSSSRASRSIWDAEPFLGVYNPALSMAGQGRHPDGRWNECPEIAFTMQRAITNTCGSFSLASPCPGGQPWSLGDCIEAKLGGRVIRGPLYDTFLAGQPSLGLEIGAWDRLIDNPAMDIDWYIYAVTPSNIAFTYGTDGGASPSWMRSMPRIVWRKITDDPVCQSSSQPVDPIDEIWDITPAEIVEVWRKQGDDDVTEAIWPVPGSGSLDPEVSTKSL